ncbi:hypothetical protein GK675_04165 [Bifidobacteriaceae bacterium NR002]|nr:hypothetical protein [Bifidobacteriaceae bacterium NR002]
MKTMLEHREDRFSPTLHLVGEWSIARICDGTGMLAKEACMQPTQQKRTLTPEHIARIRAARRAAIRRRCVLVASLALLTFLVLLAGFSGLFSPAFALIPGAMLAVVLYFGSRASKHARQWEAHVAKMNARSKQNVEDALYERHNSTVANQLSNSNANSSQIDAVEDASDFESQNDGELNNFDNNSNNSIHHSSRDDTATSVMEQREIRVALRRAEEERDAVLRSRSVAKASESKDESSNNVVDSAEVTSNASSNQDLISFSLDSKAKVESDDSAASPAPESLEIKSTKQVVKAVSVAKDIKSIAKADSSKFHDEEKASEVEAPESSEDSLGVANLHDVLARRNA